MQDVKEPSPNASSANGRMMEKARGNTTNSTSATFAETVRDNTESVTRASALSENPMIRAHYRPNSNEKAERAVRDDDTQMMCQTTNVR